MRLLILWPARAFERVINIIPVAQKKSLDLNLYNNINQKEFYEHFLKNILIKI